MLCLMAANRPLSPSRQWLFSGLMWPCGKDGGSAWAQQYEPPLIRVTWLPSLLTVEVNTASLACHHFPGKTAVTWGQVDYIGALHYKGCSTLSSYFGCRSAFPTCSPPASTTIRDLTEYLIYFLIISQTTLHKLFQRMKKTNKQLSNSFYESSKISVSKHDKENMRKDISGEFHS